MAVFFVVHLLVLAPIGGYLYGWWRAWNRFYDTEWICTLHPEDGRETAERALRVPIDIHDPCITLIRQGNSESIPYLIGALKWQPQTSPGDGRLECTKIHCLEALKKITGVDAGENYEDWRDWYHQQSGK